MKLENIKTAITNFKKFLSSDQAYENNYLYEGIKTFHEHWDLGNEPLAKMYLKATDNQSSKRMWKVQNGHPREVMSAFFHYDRTYTKFIFKDLFNDEIGIESRLDRYVFHSKQLFNELEERFLDGPHNSHYQTKMVGSIYLAYHSPAHYLIYDWDLFQSFLPLLEVTDPPTHEDPVRYFKVGNVLFKFLMKDPEILTLHKLRLKKTIHYTAPSRMLVLELMSHLTDRSLF